MLTLSVSVDDANDDWTWTATAAECGGSRMERFASDLLTMSATPRKDGIDVWIGEGPDPFPSASTDGTREPAYGRFGDFEGIKIRLGRHGGAASIKLVRTLAGACPIYLATQDDRFVASWKFEDAVGALEQVRPNTDACRIFLEEGASQVRQQVIDGVFMLWPGESVHFDGQRLSFQEIENPEIVIPATLADSARASDEFLRLLAESMRPLLFQSRNPVVEVSGGYDSSCVAVAARSVRDQLRSYGVMIEGAVGRQQANRRTELIELLGLEDFQIDSASHLPLASLEAEECAMTPFDEMYRLHCLAAVERIGTRTGTDVDLVVTGIGGDELAAENSHVRRPWEVAGSVSASSIVAAASRADMFMRRGIWTCNPCTALRVVDFCRALPRRLREGRMIHILALARAGLSDGFLFPRYAENFGALFQREASLYDFDAALADCVVADYRIADISGLLERAREAARTGFSHELIIKLYLLLKLDKVLRTYVG